MTLERETLWVLMLRCSPPRLPPKEERARKAPKGRRKGREKAGCATKAKEKKEKTTDFKMKKSRSKMRENMSPGKRENERVANFRHYSGVFEKLNVVLSAYLRRN